MTTAQAAVMVVVSSNGPVSQKHIADTLMQRESAVTTMADRLLKAGYVTRKRSAEDRRAWLLDATPKGREALAAIRKPFQTINAILDHSFRDIDQFALANALKLLLRELNDTPTEL
ncbi:MAG: MarR family transcriptional regulator [Pseudomonadota bacterium]